MKAHLRYARYVVRHKWFVFQAGRRLGVSFWQLLTHDWSKFLPGEWFPYVAFFYGGPHRPWAEVMAYEKTHHLDAARRTSKEGVKAAFNAAWLAHIHHQPHHWQHWLLHLDDGGVKILPMPERYIREMVADWIGAGQAQGKGLDDLPVWYAARRETMLLNDDTRARVEQLIAQEAE